MSKKTPAITLRDYILSILKKDMQPQQSVIKARDAGHLTQIQLMQKLLGKPGPDFKAIKVTTKSAG